MILTASVIHIRISSIRKLIPDYAVLVDLVVFFVFFFVVFLLEVDFFEVVPVFFLFVLLFVDFAVMKTPPYDGNTNYNYSI